MSRFASSQTDVVYVKPTNNIYTALAGVGVIVTGLSLLLLFLRAKSVLGEGFSFF